MTIEDIVALLAVGLGSPILLEIVQAIIRGVQGRESKRRTELDRAFQERDRARERAEEERMIARRWEEHALKCWRMLHRAECVDPKEIPGWPVPTEKGSSDD